MVILTEQIEILASYEKMEAWTANFEEEFVKWSPYHIECVFAAIKVADAYGRYYLDEE